MSYQIEQYTNNHALVIERRFLKKKAVYHGTPGSCADWIAKRQKAGDGDVTIHARITIHRTH